MKRLFGIMVVVVSLLGISPSAFANAPTRETVPFETIVFPDIYGCGFEMRLEALSNKAKLTTFYDKKGNVRLQLITGAMKVRLTNLVTNTAVNLNVSGPRRDEFLPDGSLRITWQGPQLLFTQDGSSVAGLPPAFFSHGRIVLEVSETKFNVSTPGRIQNVCNLLTS